MKLNNVEIKQKYFAFDTCHKIYILSNQEEMHHAIELGYKIKPINELVKTYNSSCRLKFIAYWDLGKSQIVNQCSGNKLYKKPYKKEYTTKGIG